MQSKLMEGELREGSIKLSMNVDELRVKMPGTQKTKTWSSLRI